jgi:hypothetical protein
MTDGILKRPRTDPIVIHMDSSNEYWVFRSSLVTTDGLGRDTDLPDNVRVYFMSSQQHGPALVPVRGICQQLNNPLPRGALLRAVLVAIDEWVTRGVRPPKSRYPRVKDGTLVAPDQASTGFPDIPGVVYHGLVNASGVRDFGPLVMGNHGLVTLNPPVAVPGGEHTVLVAKVDEDGNDVAGVRVAQLEVPLATHTGWNTRAAGFSEGDQCDLSGMYLPFARTKAEREATGDPRKSLEERYKTHEKYVKEVEKAAKKLLKQGFLLEEDYDRIVAEAEASDVLR